MAAAVMALFGAGVALPSGHPTQTAAEVADVAVMVVNAPGRGCADAEAATSTAQRVRKIFI
jgi:hypothetical protein